MRLNKLLIFIIQNSLVFTLVTGCIEISYMENKIQIESFSITPTGYGEATLNLSIKYVADSTRRIVNSKYLHYLQKGLDGSKSTILYFGISGKDSLLIDERCDWILSEFISGFNKHTPNFIGEELEKPMRLCSTNDDTDFSRFILVLQDESGIIDTLYNQSKIVRQPIK